MAMNIANALVGDLSAAYVGDFNVNIHKDTPADSYFDSLWTTPLNWDFYTVEQPNADDRQIEWPRGKVLGGS